MLMESLMDSLLGFAFFSNWLAPSFCNKLGFKPVFAFKIDSVFKTFEIHKWPINNSGSVGAEPPSVASRRRGGGLVFPLVTRSSLRSLCPPTGKRAIREPPQKRVPWCSYPDKGNVLMKALCRTVTCSRDSGGLVVLGGRRSPSSPSSKVMAPVLVVPPHPPWAAGVPGSPWGVQRAMGAMGRPPLPWQPADGGLWRKGGRGSSAPDEPLRNSPFSADSSALAGQK